MKKVVFVVVLCFACLIIPNAVLADVEEDYATALKYYNTGKYEEAVTYFKAYVEKRPDPNAYYRIGYALYELGRHDEAMEYFQAAYLIDPEVSPSPAEFIEQYKRGKAKKELVPPVMEPEPQPPQVKMEAPALTEKPAAGVEPAKPGAPVERKVEEPIAPPPLTEEPVSKPEPEKLVPPREIQPPSGFPPLAKPEGEMPFEIPPGLIAVMAGLGIIFQIIGLALYIFMALCHFLIGKKLDVTASWLAFIPLIGAFWPLVGAARKPWWWILILIFIPLVNLILFIYLYMLVSENLGKNKWLGLLMLVPLVNLFFLGFLAFSRTDDASRYYAGEPLT